MVVLLEEGQDINPTAEEMEPYSLVSPSEETLELTTGFFAPKEANPTRAKVRYLPPKTPEAETLAKFPNASWLLRFAIHAQLGTLSLPSTIALTLSALISFFGTPQICFMVSVADPSF